MHLDAGVFPFLRAQLFVAVAQGCQPHGADCAAEEEEALVVQVLVFGVGQEGVVGAKGVEGLGGVHGIFQVLGNWRYDTWIYDRVNLGQGVRSRRATPGER